MDILYKYSCSQEGALKEFWNWATGKPDPYIVDHKLNTQDNARFFLLSYYDWIQVSLSSPALNTYNYILKCLQELSCDYRGDGFTSYDNNYKPKYNVKSDAYLNMVKNLNFDKICNQLKPMYSKLGITADQGYKLYLPSFSITDGILPSVFSNDYSPTSLLPVPDSGFNHMNVNRDNQPDMETILKYIRSNLTRLQHRDPSPVGLTYNVAKDIDANKRHTKNNPIWQAAIFVLAESIHKPDIYPYNGYYNRYGIHRLETDDIKKINVILDYVEKTYLK